MTPPELDAIVRWMLAPAPVDWRGVLARRWAYVDQFDASGDRYLIARLVDRDPLALLTVREREVVEQATRGHTNKVIAYEVGLTSSTVGVLLHRAAKKLGAQSREELLECARRS